MCVCVCVCICVCVCVWLSHKACRILVPQPEIESGPSLWKSDVLTPGPQGIPRGQYVLICWDILCKTKIKTIIILRGKKAAQNKDFSRNMISSVQSLTHVRLFAAPWIAAQQASLSITRSWSLLRLMSIKSVMPSSHLILCRPLLLLPSIPPSIRDFSNESTLCMRWPKYWSFSFSISPSSEHPGLISFRMDWLDLLAVQGTLSLFQHHSSKASIFSTQPSSQFNSHIHKWPQEIW